MLKLLNIYVQRKDSLNKIVFEESFTRYKTHVIIACAKSIYSEVIREKMKFLWVWCGRYVSSLGESVSFSGYVIV